MQDSENVQREIIKNTKSDVLLVSSVVLFMHLVPQWLKMNNVQPFNDSWKYSSIGLISGFVFYNMLVQQHVLNYANTNNYTPVTKTIFNDIIKFSIIFTLQELVSAKLVSRPTKFDKEWMESSGYTILGYVLFDMIQNNITPYTTERNKQLVYDSIKLTMGQITPKLILNNTLTYSDFVDVGSIITAVMVYHLTLKPNFI
jgi:hypothetical protein